MLEIPESFNLAKLLNQTVKNKVIKNVAAAQFPHKFAFYFNDNPDNYNALLSGKKIKKICPYLGRFFYLLKPECITQSQCYSAKVST